jgi:hypothetical protein
MMKTLSSMLMAAFAVVVFSAALAAEEKKDAPKEVTLKGTILCAKCELKETKTCVTAIQVKEGDKKVTYYLDDKGNKEDYHENVCGGGIKEGTVTGVVTEKDGKKWIKPSKVDFVKK